MKGPTLHRRLTPMDLMELVKFAVQNRATDIHLQAGTVPMIRVAGQMRLLDLPLLGADEARKAIRSILPPTEAADLDAAMQAGLDFSHEITGVARLRCGIFSQLGKAGLVLRVLPTGVPSIEALNLPPVVEDVALQRRGLVLVSGTSGCGKSTTLAAMIERINSVYRTKIITLEDPVEHILKSKKSMISQLEVGRDTPSFEHGFRHALRRDPDIILVGELRDAETLSIALRAADTGRQVLAAVHSADAARTLQRIIAMFPPAERPLLLSQFARSLEAVVSQRLVADREDRSLPAVEILRGSASTEKFILENDFDGLSEYMARGELGMQTFDQHLLELYNDKKIAGTQAMRWSTHPKAMSLAMRGIRHLGSGLGE